MSETWVEVNIHMIDEKETNTFIKKHLGAIVGSVQFLSKVRAWHFFREPEIRLRVQVDDKVEVEAILSGYLSSLQERGKFVSHFIFGKHGKAGEEYTGEEVIWGKLWPIAKDMYQYTSELALGLLKNEGDTTFFLRRYVHLFFDQLGFSQAEESAELAKQSQQAMAAHIKEIQLGLVK